MSDPIKAYDIRGICPQEVNEELALRVGSHYVFHNQIKGVVVGGDARTWTNDLRSALIRGLRQGATTIIDIGTCTTPQFYWAVEHLHAEGGIMITASHNPAEYSGFKIVGDHAYAYPGETIRLFLDKPITKGATILGRVHDIDLDIAYLMNTLPAKISLNSKKDILLWDLGYCLSSNAYSFLELLGLPISKAPENTEFLELYDPFNPKIQEGMKVFMQSGTYTFGAMLDGDGDRIVFFDENGNVVSANVMLPFIARAMGLSAGKDAVVYDQRMSKAVPRLLREQCIYPIPSRVGHVFIKEAMRYYFAMLGGELSGHYMLGDPSRNYYAEHPLKVLYHVAALLDHEQVALSEVVKKTSYYSHSGEINFHVPDPNKVMDSIKYAYHRDIKNCLDGFNIEYDNWWFNIRPSNTEPLIRLVVEGDDEVLMQKGIDQLAEQIEKFSKE